MAGHLPKSIHRTLTLFTDELEQMLYGARRSAKEWNEFLEAFVQDPKIIARAKKAIRDSNRAVTLIHAVRQVIPPKANRKDPPACHFMAYH